MVEHSFLCPSTPADEIYSESIRQLQAANGSEFAFQKALLLHLAKIGNELENIANDLASRSFE